MSEEVEKWELPLRLRWSDENPEFEELVRRSEAKQKEWEAKTNKPFARQTPLDAERGMARIRIQAKRDALASLSPDDPMYARVAGQLAEAYSITGRFDLAAEIDPRPKYRQEWQALADAVMREGDDRCACPNMPRAKGTHPIFQERSVWSLRLNREVFLLRCNNCGFRYTTESKPAHLVEQEIARAKAAK